MKFQVTFKDPDALFNSLPEVAEEIVKKKAHGLDEREWKYLTDNEQERLKNFTQPWIEWGEYVCIEFDTELGTATVIKHGGR